MNLKMNISLGDKYEKSNSQKAKDITENWLLENYNCPFCNSKLTQYNANHKCADFYCKKCNEDFELKTKNGKFSKSKMTGSAYKTTLEKIESDKNSNWILVEHKNYIVNNLILIPKYFFYDKIVEPRKPLKDTARRAGWQGCTINLNLIPSFGKIMYIKNGLEVDKKIIRYHLNQAEKIKDKNIKNKNWKLEILYLIDSLPESIFTLKDINKLIPILQSKYPNNKNIDAKIREMLQELRDDHYIIFLDKGLYQKLF